VVFGYTRGEANGYPRQRRHLLNVHTRHRKLFLSACPRYSVARQIGDAVPFLQHGLEHRKVKTAKDILRYCVLRKLDITDAKTKAKRLKLLLEDVASGMEEGRRSASFSDMCCSRLCLYLARPRHHRSTVLPPCTCATHVPRSWYPSLRVALSAHMALAWCFFTHARSLLAIRLLLHDKHLSARFAGQLRFILV
jgi:hypothetical protein